MKETLEELKNEYEIIIVSMGDTPNLNLKLWIKEIYHIVNFWCQF